MYKNQSNYGTLYNSCQKTIKEDVGGLESVLCLATLIANGRIVATSTLETSMRYFEEGVDADCSNCKYTEKCLACRINE